jgi:beta-glucanase (GH16 family)
MMLGLAMCFTLGQPGAAGARSGTTADEFDMRAGSPPDPGLWGYDTGTGWGAGGEVQTYTNSIDNVYQDGDHLVLQAIRSDDGTYTSGRIKTQGRFEMVYGRVEARIQMPPGPGTLPAFWLLGADYPVVGHPESGEIDIIEYVQSAFHHTLHGPGTGEDGVSRSWVPPFDPSAEFHTYWAERSPNMITIGVDDIITAVFTPASLPAGATWVYDKPMFAVLSFAIGSDGSWAGTPPAGTPFPQQMVVDWFRYTP